MGMECNIEVSVKVPRSEKEKQEILRLKEEVKNESDYTGEIISMDVKTKSFKYSPNLKKKEILESNDDYWLLEKFDTYSVPSKHATMKLLDAVMDFYKVRLICKYENIPLTDMEKIIENTKSSFHTEEDELLDYFRSNISEFIEVVKSVVEKAIKNSRETEVSEQDKTEYEIMFNLEFC